MPQGIVDNLEAVEVQTHDRQSMFGSVAIFQGMGESFKKQQPVRQVGEQIVVRQIMQTFLGLHALGDVFARGDIMRDVACPVFEGGNGLLLIIEHAVLVAIDQHILKHFTPRYGRP